MKNVTKQDLVINAAQSSGHSQLLTKRVADELLKVIGEYLAADKTIEIRKFGTFCSKTRKSRPARNPQTGEPCTLPSYKAPLLKFSSEIKESLEELPGWVDTVSEKPEMVKNPNRSDKALWQ